ncbi:MAG: phenylalanine--tRNA ligase subunit alpha [Acidiferrobacter sp.]
MSEPFAERLERLGREAVLALADARDPGALDAWRVRFLGKSGILTEELKRIGTLSVEERPHAGQLVNQVKKRLDEAHGVRRSALLAEQHKAQLAAEAVDVTLPGRGLGLGGLHPLTRALRRIEDIFAGLGFVGASGPEVEDEFHNFEALNIPAHHPARAMHDTFYLKNGSLLRTHTSTVQIRFMEQNTPPFRIIAPGRVYRADALDPTHSPIFYQVEGLVVGEGIHMGHLKATLHHFLESFFERPLSVRLRPSYFPFTEPSAEVDISCLLCRGAGCRVCKGTGYVEVLGCGLVHPAVLTRLGIDAERFSGFAFGMGVERLLMLREGVPDVRLFYENDLRFLRSLR